MELKDYIKKIKIGDIVVNTNVFLAPMAGVTDMPFRYICNKYGKVSYMPTEMVSSKGLIYKDFKTHKIMDMFDLEYPKVVQIFGNDVDILKKVIEKLNSNPNVDIIDFNMGCPAPKVVKNGDGSELLKDLNKVEEIIKTLVSVSKKPITVKTRLGISDDEITVFKVAKICEKYGVSMLTIHGRTQKQGYMGHANIEMIAKVKESVKIPVVGNGDIVDIESAYEMFTKTNVDAIMIGRKALGNPWIFRSIIENKEYVPSLKERYSAIIDHLNLAIKYDKESVAIPKMRKHIAWYLKGLNNSSYAKDLINKQTTYEGVKKILDEYFLDLNKKTLDS